MISAYGAEALRPYASDAELRRAELHRATGALRLAAAGLLNRRDDLLSTGLRNFTDRVNMRTIAID